MAENVKILNTLNIDMDLDFFHQYIRKYEDLEPATDPYASRSINSLYYNMSSLPSIQNVSSTPIYLSINIQSLNSKYEQLKHQILDLLHSNVKIDAIAIQETWEIRYPDTLSIPGFQELIFKNREGMRGWGVGFYVRTGLNYKIIEELSPFENKILESLTIKLEYPGKRAVLLTSAYRSNGVIPGVTETNQLERFFTKFDELLHDISRINADSIVFMDSNINLLNLNEGCSAYFLDLFLSRGFLQCVMKATRFQNNSKTLLDNIFTTKSGRIISGTVISDISDNFFTFIQSTNCTAKGAEKTHTVRDFSDQNLNNFKAALGGANWDNVLNSNNVDHACDELLSIYNDLYNVIFPLRTIRFNKNVHNKQPFMSNGLLKSRAT
jgi:hypothetical protein